MMKRLNSILLLLLGQVILLTGCGRDNLEVAGGDDGQESAGKAYMSLNIMSDKQIMTRDLGDTEPGTNQEQSVSNVIILLYKNTGTPANDNLAYGWILNATNRGDTADDRKPFENMEGLFADDMVLMDSADGYSGPTETSFRTVAVEVEAQPYYLVVFANGFDGNHVINGLLTDDEDEGAFDWDTGVITPNPEIPIYNLHEMMEIDQMLSNRLNMEWEPVWPGYYYDAASEHDDTEWVGDFFMSNANGPVPVEVSDLKSTPGGAQDAPVDVSLDRAVAKVLVNAIASQSGTPVYSGGKVAGFQWKLKNINGREYLLRHYAPLLNSPGTEETYLNSIGSRAYLYAKDPNYIKRQQTTDDFEYEWVRYADWNTWDGSKIDERDWRYTTENTIDLDSQSDDNWKDYTTYVYARIIIEYEAFPSPVQGSVISYYSFEQKTGAKPGWKVFSHSQALEWISSGEFPADMSDLSILIGSCTTSGEPNTYVPGTSGFKFYEGGTPVDEEDYVRYNDTYDTIVVSDKTVDPSITEASIWFHPYGLNEYDIPIKHHDPNDGTRTGTYGHYGVVRNNVYRLTITGINGPGIPHTQAKWISTNITINEWFRRDQSEVI